MSEWVQVSIRCFRVLPKVLDPCFTVSSHILCHHHTLAESLSHDTIVLQWWGHCRLHEDEVPAHWNFYKEGHHHYDRHMGPFNSTRNTQLCLPGKKWRACSGKPVWWPQIWIHPELLEKWQSANFQLQKYSGWLNWQVNSDKARGKKEDGGPLKNTWWLPFIWTTS